MSRTEVCKSSHHGRGVAVWGWLVRLPKEASQEQVVRGTGVRAEAHMPREKRVTSPDRQGEEVWRQNHSVFPLFPGKFSRLSALEKFVSLEAFVYFQ